MPCKPPQPTVPANTCGCAVLAVSTRKFLMPGCQDKSHNCKSTASPAPVQLSSCRNTKPYGYKGSFIQMLGLQLNVPGVLNLQKGNANEAFFKASGKTEITNAKALRLPPSALLRLTHICTNNSCRHPVDGQALPPAASCPFPAVFSSSHICHKLPGWLWKPGVLGNGKVSAALHCLQKSCPLLHP